MTSRPRVVAFYLPQFHPIPENDALGGRGFTEWVRVRSAVPLYRGHHQPMQPGELGYYDLRDAEVREAQAELATAHGVAGFCYWHYWFAGRRLLERPFAEVVASGRPRLPICLAWANTSWLAEWYESSRRPIIEQTYPGREDYVRHFEALRSAFEDDRYLRVGGRCLFVVWRPEDLPNPVEFTDCWRELASRAGLSGFYFVGFRSEKEWDPIGHGFDAASVFPRSVLGDYEQRGLVSLLRRSGLSRLPGIGPERIPYESFARRSLAAGMSETSIPCVMSNWDNTPRWGRRGQVFVGATPDLFASHLKEAARQVETRPAEERLVFLRSWNEWAEGNYVEPDDRFGRGWLEAIRDVVVEGGQ